MAKIDTKKHTSVRKDFGLAGLPTVIVAEAGGSEIDRTLGYVRTADFIETVDGYHRGEGTLIALLENEADHGEDLDYLVTLSERLFAHARYDDADARLARVIEIDPENTTGKADVAQLERVKIKGKASDWDTGVALSRELVKRWPDSDLAEKAMVYTGYFSDNGGKKAEAILAYKEYLARWPEGDNVEFVTEALETLQAPAAKY